MPPKQARPSSDLDSDSSSDFGDEPRSSALRRSAKPRESKGGNFESNVLILFGLLCIVGGAALSILPRFSWKAEQVLSGFDHLGIHGGAVAIGGMVLVGLGLVRRQLGNQGGPGASYDDLLFEQVAADIVLTRGGLERLQDLTSDMQSELSNLSREVSRLASQPAPQPVVTGGNEDALFGLAASLDKLGARLEQRLKAQHDALQTNLEQMSESLMNTRSELEASYASQLASAQALAQAPAQAPEQAPAPAPAEVAYSQPQEVRATVEDPVAEASSLGLLDSLDDFGTPPALPQRAPESATTLDPDALDELRVHIEKDLGHGTPRGRTWEEELEMIETPDPQSKLEQLHALLADEEVRAALEGFRRSGSKPQSAT
jgi:hypothetical protein